MKKKNIIIILLDGMRADRLGCYGYHRNTSPNIDALAKNGIVAKHHYSTSFCTLPAYFSMFTGLYPAVHKATSTYGYYNGRFPFLTNLLQDAGYTTIGISNAVAAFSAEWGFIRGYDKYFRIGKINNWFKESKEAKRGLIKQTTAPAPSQPLIEKDNHSPQHGVKLFLRQIAIKLIKSIIPGGYKLVTDESVLGNPPTITTEHKVAAAIEHYSKHDMGGKKAVEVFRQTVSDLVKDQSAPFFMYINLPETHQPYLPPLPYQEMFGNLELTIPLIMLNTNPNEFERLGMKLTEKEIHDLNCLYDGTVRYVDDLVGEMIQTLKDSSIFNDTVIVFVGDHGGNLYENRDYVGSAFTYEPEIHVPLIIINSEHSPETCDELTSAIDVFPTLIEAAGIEFIFPSHYQCKSLFSKERGHPFIIADYPHWPDWLVELLITESAAFVNKNNITNRTMVTCEGWKIIWRNDGKHELFHLKNDPKETMNLFWDNLIFSLSLIDQMKTFYRQLVGEVGEFLEIYPINDIGEDQENIPPVSIINPKQRLDAIISIPRELD